MAQGDLEHQMRDLADELKRLRDEIRVKLHLASLEARDRWDELEPSMGQVEKLAREVNEASKRKLGELRDRLKELVERVRRDSDQQDQPHV